MFPKEKNLSDYMREVKNLRISNIEKRVKIAIQPLHTAHLF